MSGCHSKQNEQMHLPFETMLRKIRDKYQAYCTMYKEHVTAMHHGSAGHPLDRDIDLHIEDSETTCLDNDIETTSGLDTIVALGGPEAEGHPSDLLHSNQAKLRALMREINDLHQSVEAREGQPPESLDHMRTTKSLTSTSATLFPNTC